MGKEIEMKPAINEISTTIREATSALAENLFQSEPFLRYQEANRKLHANRDAMLLLKDLSVMQQKIRTQQYSGAISESDLKLLRELQSATGMNDVIQEFGSAQQNAIIFLREINLEISSLLGVDLATLAGRSTC